MGLAICRRRRRRLRRLFYSKSFCHESSSFFTFYVHTTLSLSLSLSIVARTHTKILLKYTHPFKRAHAHTRIPIRSYYWNTHSLQYTHTHTFIELLTHIRTHAHTTDHARVGSSENANYCFRYRCESFL